MKNRTRAASPLIWLGPRRVGLAVAGYLTVLALMAAPLAAHVVYERQTLRQWAQQANTIVVAEITSPLRVWSAADGSDHQEFFSLRVVEVLAGDPQASEIDVFPHAEGAPLYEVGDRALIFLDRTAERAEFAHLASRFLYFTTQGAGHEWKLDATDETIPSIAMAWRAQSRANAYPPPRDLLLRQIETNHPRLRAEAIAELVHLRSTAAFRADAEAFARLSAMARSDHYSAGERIGLIRILDGVQEFSAASALLELAADGGDAADRIDVIRACAGIRDERLTAWLRSLLATGDSATRVAALISLGDPWHSAAVEEIAGIAAAAGSEPRVAQAAVRALGTIGDDPAIAALRALAVRESGSVGALARAQVRALERTNPAGR